MIIFNPKLAEKIGVEAALLYGAFQEMGAADSPKFTSNVEMQELTTFSNYQIRKALAALQSAGLLDTKLIGTPPQRQIVLKGVQTA